MVAMSQGERADAGTDDASLEEILEKARHDFEMVEYESAAALFLIVAQHPDATLEQRIEAWSNRAICLAGLDQEEEARDAFVAVLEIDRSYELPAIVSPKISEAFELAQAVMEARSEPDPEPEEFAAFEKPGPAPAAPPAKRPLSSWAMPVGASAAGAFAIGGVFGALAVRGERLFNDSPDTFENQREALEFRESVIGRARTANILYGTGALLAGGALALFLMDGSSGAPADGMRRESTFAVDVSLHSEGGLVGVRTHW